MPTFVIPVGLGAPPAISLGEDTSAYEPASITSTSILVELSDSEALASFVDTILLAQEETASKASQSVSSIC